MRQSNALDIATVLTNAGPAHTDQGRRSEARENLTRALILQLRVLGDRHPEIRVTMNQLAMAVEARRR